MSQPTEEPPSHDEDRSLARRLAAGDNAAFAEFWDEHAPRLYRFVRSRLGGDSDLAREIVQSALCTALGRLDSYQGRGSLFSWICGICRYQILAHYRSQRRGLQEEPLSSRPGEPGALLEILEGSAPTPEAETLRQEARRHVHEVLEGLPGRYARALEWKYAEHLSVREIARRLELSEKATESLLTRARSAFRQSYAELSESVPKVGLKGRRRTE